MTNFIFLDWPLNYVFPARWLCDKFDIHMNKCSKINLFCGRFRCAHTGTLSRSLWLIWLMMLRNTIDRIIIELISLLLGRLRSYCCVNWHSLAGIFVPFLFVCSAASRSFSVRFDANDASAMDLLQLLRPLDIWCSFGSWSMGEMQ